MRFRNKLVDYLCDWIMGSSYHLNLSVQTNYSTGNSSGGSSNITMTTASSATASNLSNLTNPGTITSTTSCLTSDLGESIPLSNIPLLNSPMINQSGSSLPMNQSQSSLSAMMVGGYTPLITPHPNMMSNTGIYGVITNSSSSYQGNPPNSFSAPHASSFTPVNCGLPNTVSAVNASNRFDFPYPNSSWDSSTPNLGVGIGLIAHGQFANSPFSPYYNATELTHLMNNIPQGNVLVNNRSVTDGLNIMGQNHPSSLVGNKSPGNYASCANSSCTPSNILPFNSAGVQSNISKNASSTQSPSGTYSTPSYTSSFTSGVGSGTCGAYPYTNTSSNYTSTIASSGVSAINTGTCFTNMPSVSTTAGIVAQTAAQTRELDLACMEAVAALLHGMPLQPEEIDRADLMDAKSHLFAKYFSLFMNLLNDVADDREKGAEVRQNHTALRNVTVQAMSNLLNANIESGLVHAIGKFAEAVYRMKLFLLEVYCS
ncbi:unnamed protein product [Trichobilharzia regenti]|nr:unnamed protein product [Trichobilharzia regenti]